MNVAKGSGSALFAYVAIAIVAFSLFAPSYVKGESINSQLLSDGTTTTSSHWGTYFVAASTTIIRSVALGVSNACGMLQIGQSNGVFTPLASFSPSTNIPGGVLFTGSVPVNQGEIYYILHGSFPFPCPAFDLSRTTSPDVPLSAQIYQVNANGNWMPLAANNFGSPIRDIVYSVCSDSSCGFAPAQPPAQPCTADCNDNVLFIPGIESNRLYDTENGETRLWEPNSDADLEKLALDPSGHSVRQDVYAKDGDVLDEAYISQLGPNIYKSFILKMNDLKQQGKIADWHAAAYDWRLSMDQILSNGFQSGNMISYLAATSTPYIEQELRTLAATSRTGKVTIVAHSNGGLVAKALMRKLGDAETARLIDRVILVASPQVGTPSAIASLLHGYESSIPLKTSDAATRTLGDNSPTAYNLLPSASYFMYVDDPVMTFASSSLPDWAARYGDTVHSDVRQHAMLTDSYDRVSAASSDIRDPTQLSNSLLTQAEAFHAALDSWTPPPSVQVIQIAGWGVPTTIKGLGYASTTKPASCSSCESGLTVMASTTIDGDGTVVVPSALWMSTSTLGIKDYWVDLKKYNSLANRIATGYVGLPFDHKNILETSGVLSLISDAITNVTPSAGYQFISSATPQSSFGDTRLRYELHSPLTLNLYDDEGHHTGVSTTTGQIEEQVPGTYYSELAGVKYLYTDTSSSAHIVMSGYDTGAFTFSVDELQGDIPVTSATFQDIPVTPHTKVALDIQSDITTLSPMHLDEDGTGHIVDLAPKLGGVVTLDTTVPATTLSLAGSKGQNGWYTSNVIATLTATDTESGIGSISYSLDGAPTTTSATSTLSLPIITEGVHILSYFATDAVGNQELSTTTVIRLDKTPPEASVGFSTSTKSVLVFTLDASSTVSSNATSTTIRDQAGNSLVLGTKTSLSSGSTTFAISSLEYSTGTTSDATTALRYFWSTDKKGKYRLLISAIRTPTDRLLVIYTSVTNQTYLISTNAADDNKDLSLRSSLLLIRSKLKSYNGLMIPKISTNQGDIIISY